MADTVHWLGQEEFLVYEGDTTGWNDTSGVYVFARIDLNRQGGGQWVALYIGQTESFAERFSKHEKWPEAARQGSTHIHAKTVAGDAARKALERRMIDRYKPPLNYQ